MHMQVAMHPVVNTVDDSHSRIRTLEDQVARLRRELAQKENAPPPPPPEPSVKVDDASEKNSEQQARTAGMHERLQAQLAQNQELIRHRETLARCASRVLFLNEVPRQTGIIRASQGSCAQIVLGEKPY